MPKLNESPVKQPSEGQVARAAERARLAQMAESEWQPPEDTPPETPSEPPSPDDEPSVETGGVGDVVEDEIPEGPTGEPDGTVEPPKRRSRSEVWAAIKAQEERFNSGLTNLQKALDEKLNGFLGKLDELKPPPQEEEVDPELAAWDAALKEGVTKHVSPELSAFKKQQFLDKVELSIELARVKYKDFDDVVGDIWDPNNPLMKYLQANDGDSKQIFTSRNIGEALRNKAIFLKEGTAEARESWRQKELEKLRKENEAELAKMKADLMKEFKGVIAKGQNGNSIKSTSIAGDSGGSAADDPSPLKTAMKNRDKRAIEDLVRRGELGEEIN